jgi:hypothetical protein
MELKNLPRLTSDYQKADGSFSVEEEPVQPQEQSTVEPVETEL